MRIKVLIPKNLQNAFWIVLPEGTVFWLEIVLKFNHIFFCVVARLHLLYAQNRCGKPTPTHHCPQLVCAWNFLIMCLEVWNERKVKGKVGRKRERRGMVNQPFSFFRYFKILVTLTDVFRAFVNRPFTLPKTILCLLNLVLVAHHHIQWSRESVWVIFMMSVILSFNTFLNFGTSTRWAAIILAPVPCFGGFCSVFMIFF